MHSCSYNLTETADKTEIKKKEKRLPFDIAFDIDYLPVVK